MLAFSLVLKGNSSNFPEYLAIGEIRITGSLEVSFCYEDRVGLGEQYVEGPVRKSLTNFCTSVNISKHVHTIRRKNNRR